MLGWTSPHLTIIIINLPDPLTSTMLANNNRIIRASQQPEECEQVFKLCGNGINNSIYQEYLVEDYY